MSAMKTVIVTSGRDKLYHHWATLLVDHINRMATEHGTPRALDITPKVPWNKVTYPPMSKCFAWQCVDKSVDRLIWLDADVLMHKPILESALPKAIFAAVPDPYIAKADITGTRADFFTGQRAILMNLPRYFNTACVAATRDAEEAFEFAIECQRSIFNSGDNWTREMDAFNYAVWKKLDDWAPLDEAYNVMPGCTLDANVDPIVYHLASMPQSEKMRAVKAFYRNH